MVKTDIRWHGSRVAERKRWRNARRERYLSLPERSRMVFVQPLDDPVVMNLPLGTRRLHSQASRTWSYQIRKLPSIGCTANNKSGLWCQSLSKHSIFESRESVPWPMEVGPASVAIEFIDVALLRIQGVRENLPIARTTLKYSPQGMMTVRPMACMLFVASTFVLRSRFYFTTFFPTVNFAVIDFSVLRDIVVGWTVHLFFLYNFFRQFLEPKNENKWYTDNKRKQTQTNAVHIHWEFLQLV